MLLAQIILYNKYLKRFVYRIFLTEIEIVLYIINLIKY